MKKNEQNEGILRTDVGTQYKLINCTQKIMNFI